MEALSQDERSVVAMGNEHGGEHVGAAGVHFEDQLASEKKCGHMGGKVLIPTSQAVKNLKAARLAADIADVPLIILARTDANAAKLITNDHDENDKPFLTGERSPEGFYYVKSGIDQAISRGLAYAPYSDLIWCETATPNLEEAKKFADAIHKKYPGKLLAYNCSPSFNWKKHGKIYEKKIGDNDKSSFLLVIAEEGGLEFSASPSCMNQSDERGSFRRFPLRSSITCSAHLIELTMNCPEWY